MPVSATSSFSKYTADDFSRRDQFTLSGLVAGLVADRVLVMLSNADDPDGLSRRVFSRCAAEGAAFHLLQVPVSRSISAAAASRGTVSELLAVSWGPQACRDVDQVAAAGVCHISSSGPSDEGWAAVLPAARRPK